MFVLKRKAGIAMNKVIKIYASLDKAQQCALPIYGKDSLSVQLLKVQSEVRSLKNRAMRMSYDYDQAQYEYFKYMERCKQEYGLNSYPSAQPSDFSKYKTFDGYLYDALAKDYPLMNKRISATVTRKVWGEYKKDKGEILSGKKSLRTYREGQPIPIRAKDTKLLYEDNFDYTMTVSVFSKDAAKTLGMKPGGCRFILHEQTDSEKAILDRLLSGEYKLCETLLAYDDRKNHDTKMARGWYFCIGYSFEKDTSNPSLDKDKILGVDIGVANVIYLGWSKDDHFKKYIPGSEIRKFQATEERRKKDILRCSVARGDGNVGHGRKCATRKAEKHEHHIHNFKETKNWHYAHFVVDTAVENGFGTIQMEDLSGINKSETFDRTWTFYSLQQKIEQLAAENGIVVKKVKPQYTSQMCSKCGYISSRSRRSQSEFRCVSCDYRRNADHNAAMNISKSKIEALVEEQLLRQGGEAD
ncbi:MAG: transposase [Clostridia bacterium]|nr:transposase [Clostridia bacterium]